MFRFMEVTIMDLVKKNGDVILEQYSEDWDLVIDSKKNTGLGIKGIAEFKDLLFLLVKRDVITIYKQTILGPLWLVLQPLLTALTFTIIFGKIAGLSTNGIPQFLFYYSGIVLWSFFSEIVLKVSDTFTSNADLFSKVFFPRMVIPFSIVITAFIKAAVNFSIFFIVWLYFYFQTDSLQFNLFGLVFIPILFILPAVLGLGIGLVITALTSKYKDLKFFILFGIQLLLYMSPIIYPLSLLSGTYKTIISLNPVSAPVESFRSVFFNGSIDLSLLLYSATVSGLILAGGMIIFHKKEKSFIDLV